uniref:Uncharacterized protein n=1 Tax=uncultured Acidobacteriales bacterium HF0200_23L05 TaxID=710732 RepID=E0XUK1_9BACT|nr:hypothetical protein [uncultured Acidobacteriales bacterium HF0200_23L05]
MARALKLWELRLRGNGQTVVTGGPTRIDSVVSEVLTSITMKGVERNVAALTRGSC